MLLSLLRSFTENLTRLVACLIFKPLRQQHHCKRILPAVFEKVLTNALFLPLRRVCMYHFQMCNACLRAIPKLCLLYHPNRNCSASFSQLQHVAAQAYDTAICNFLTEAVKG